MKSPRYTPEQMNTISLGGDSMTIPRRSVAMLRDSIHSVPDFCTVKAIFSEML